jgi:hypothetical protein
MSSQSIPAGTAMSSRSISAGTANPSQSHPACHPQTSSSNRRSAQSHPAISSNRRSPLRALRPVIPRHLGPYLGRNPTPFPWNRPKAWPSHPNPFPWKSPRGMAMSSQSISADMAKAIRLVILHNRGLNRMRDRLRDRMAFDPKPHRLTRDFPFRCWSGYKYRHEILSRLLANPSKLGFRRPNSECRWIGR